MRAIHAMSLGVVLLLSFLIFGGCAYKINYSLRPSEIIRAQETAAIKVAVAGLDDRRNSIERQKSTREANGAEDAGDYTYDKDFKGIVAGDVTRMLVSHLEYSECFREISALDKETSDLDRVVLDSLADEGVDAVMIGSLENFYGYYDRNQGSEILMQGGLGLAFGTLFAIMTTSRETSEFGWGGEITEIKINPIAISLGTSGGMMLGSYLESLKKRDTECHTRIAVKLLSTSTGEIVWEETGDASEFEHRAMPGLKNSKRKHELAVSSLKDAIN
ncbi:MAG: hypothetical protein JRJ85_26975, partial [Deltaproteobacteria bacterium]|nr:hypothetical protein [Deltaproteobacteria bacterium]